MDSALVFGCCDTGLRIGDGLRVIPGQQARVAASAAPGEPREILLCVESDVVKAVRRVFTHTPDLIVVDARDPKSPGARHGAEFLERLFPPDDLSGPARRGRTLVLVSEDAAGARLAFRAGAKRVADVLVMPSDAQILERIRALASRAGRGRIAVCLAGGGIEGLLYEVGVLRAIDACLQGLSVCDLDLFCGISAGSILGSFLANGLTPGEIAEGLRVGGPRLDRISRWDIFDPNFREIGQRAVDLARYAVGHGRARNVVSAVSHAVPTAAFAGDALREYFRRQLQRPGASDAFPTLRRPLLVGATDQDTSEAVVFGEPGWDHVPVHKAVRASCALTPFFAPEPIDGRWYIDGAFTRTTNMRVAVKHGATLVILIDPLVPIVADGAGYVRARGGIFSTMQGLKSLINGRFDKAVTAIREMYPDVAFHLFRPEGEDMKILSGSPMKFLYREEIEERAYQSTMQLLKDAQHEMARDFERAGIVFRVPGTTPEPLRRAAPDGSVSALA